MEYRTNLKIIARLAAIWIAACAAAYPQSVAAIQQDLATKYVLTQPTAALDDIVTAGSVLTLRKGHVVMAPVSSTNVCQNTYKDGKLTQNFICKGLTRPFPGTTLPAGMATRTFVPGEKLWLTKIDVRDDSVILGLFTDAFKNAEGADVRYKADLKFAYPKGVQLNAGQVEALIAEVFSVQAAAPAEGATQQTSGQPAGQPVATPPPPIIPPPPPPPSDTGNPAGSAR